MKNLLLFVFIGLLLLVAGCTPFMLPDRYVFSLTEVNKTNCYGQFAADYIADRFQEEFTQYTNIYDPSKGYVREGRIVTMEEKGLYGYKLQFAPNSAIKKACLKLSKRSLTGLTLICEDCTTTFNQS